ncbi:g protein-coupled receptor [Anaeramoeba ignava]|uniref:G protein-coupled receptor n=1 Tax=Anaeramoeba ignava TaxID=1746090 RepID=A0A9Q0LT16_ANAIG|nr:g protein-coupled receptor [Anaeramoeba ignava]
MKTEDLLTIIGASLGTTGALIILIIYFRFKEWKNFYRKLIFILSIYDFVHSLSFLLPGHSNKIICRIQGELIAGFGSTCQFWSAAISFLSYLKVVKGFNEKKLNKIQKLFHLLMWLIVVFFASFVAFFPNPTYARTYWCFCSHSSFIITFYIFVWTFLIICLISYILTLIRLRKIVKFILNKNPSSKKSEMNQIWVEIRMSFIPLIYILIFIPTTIRRIYDIHHSPDKSIPAIDIPRALLSSTHGFWDFLIFIVFDSEMRKKIYNKCSKNTQKLEILEYPSFEQFDDDNNHSLFHKDFVDQKFIEHPLLEFEGNDQHSIN